MKVLIQSILSGVNRFYWKIRGPRRWIQQNPDGDFVQMEADANDYCETWNFTTGTLPEFAHPAKQ